MEYDINITKRLLGAYEMSTIIRKDELCDSDKKNLVDLWNMAWAMKKELDTLKGLVASLNKSDLPY